MKIIFFNFFISIVVLASSFFLLASSQRIDLNNTITSIDNINPTNLPEKTIFSENGKFIYFLSSNYIYYNDLDSVLLFSSSSSPPSSSLPTTGFKYPKNTNNLRTITSVPFIGNDSKIITITNNYIYIIDIAQKISTEKLIGLQTLNDFNCYITNYLTNGIFITVSDSIYSKYDLLFLDSQLSIGNSAVVVNQPQTMLITDTINKLIFYGNKGMIRLFDATSLSSTLLKTPLFTISDSVSRYIGSFDIENKLLYTCSRNEANNPTMKLSFEILKYSSNSMSILKSVDINFSPKLPSPYFSKCNFSSIDLIQGQIFFTLIDTLQNQYILSMDINGNNQELFEINNNNGETIIITGLTIKRSLNNKLIVGTKNIGNQILILNYKSICKNDCGGSSNGECVNLKCICEEGFGLDDCSQRYPVLSKVSSIPLKRTPAIITIDGDYFGTDVNKVSVKIGNSSYSCVNIELVNQKQIKCTFSDTLLDHPTIPKSSDGIYYNVFVTIGELSVESFKFKYLLPNFQNSIQQDFDKIKITGYNLMDLQYQSLFKLANSNINKLDCIGTINEIICILPSDSVNGDLTISDIYNNSHTWSNVILNPQLISLSPSLISTSPTDLTITGLFFTSIIGTKIGDNFQLKIGDNSKTFIIKSSSKLEFKTNDRIISNTTISLENSKSSLNFGYLSPSITSFIQPSDNSNGLLRIQGTNFVNPLDKNLLQIILPPPHFGDLISNVLDLNVNYIDINLPNDFISSLITISINGKLSNETNSDGTGGTGLKYLNLRPIITNITPLPSIKGNDNITITGNYLTKYVYMIINNNNNKNILNCDFISGNKVICKVPIGSGKFKIISESVNPYNQNDVLTSKEFESSYAPPNITSITPIGFFSAISPNGFTITINGNNFITDKSLTKILISDGNIDCAILGSITDTTIKCNFVSDQNQWTTKIPVNLTQNSLSTTFNDGFYHFTHCPGSPYECSNNGKCNYLTGLCDCNHGYQIKSDCSVSTTIVSSTTTTSTTSTSTVSTTSSQTGSPSTTSTSSNQNTATTSSSTSSSSSTPSPITTTSTTSSSSTPKPTTSTSISGNDPSSSSNSGVGTDPDNTLSSSNSYKSNLILIIFTLFFVSILF
ncbi:hypothetical protein DDB_G0277103 [Dictyostelium discoideum AX4]|uniref:EGF-like domain-containing protein n=1 Tax=Dictyostelium discoideum TaxID=44689 RepID=Q550H5_DICDI|nr:hypothetical protein DDB_G0277103 [Dictyostelium discoideum AX4]EAL69053.1 hypothetical protein DDB_G0277103 [Dictyostelium discoideum AX4]|eukprot:XP_642957.1 hypothetical protein DDB_G0277103 [Dictyostelium discoideum AX4]